MVWNLFLAFIPLVLSLFLFRPIANYRVLWWIVLLIFIAFLPNAPYVLTDSIHLIELSQKDYSIGAIIFILIPQYTLFIFAGFEAYAVSITRLENYLQDFIAAKYLPLIKITIHSLCVIGIYIGRFERFNSWDFIAQPINLILTTAEDLLDGSKLLSMFFSLILLWLLTEFIKLVNHQIALAINPDV
ncbi:MAG: DUF1361 domain-containing protein [Cyanobacteria bacterium J06621_8]